MNDELPTGSPIASVLHGPGHGGDRHLDPFLEYRQPSGERNGASASTASPLRFEPRLSAVRDQIREADIVGADGEDHERYPLVCGDRPQAIGLWRQPGCRAMLGRQVDVARDGPGAGEVHSPRKGAREDLYWSCVRTVAVCGRSIAIDAPRSDLASPPFPDAESIGSVSRCAPSPGVAEPPAGLTRDEAVPESDHCTDRGGGRIGTSNRRV